MTNQIWAVHGNYRLNMVLVWNRGTQTKTISYPWRHDLTCTKAWYCFTAVIFFGFIIQLPVERRGFSRKRVHSPKHATWSAQEIGRPTMLGHSTMTTQHVWISLQIFFVFQWFKMFKKSNSVLLKTWNCGNWQGDVHESVIMRMEWNWH